MKKVIERRKILTIRFLIKFGSLYSYPEEPRSGNVMKRENPTKV